jgi:PAS domain S-box-containing protein
MAPTKTVQFQGLGLAADPALLLNAVVDLSDDAIVLCALNGHITSWGESAERLFGRTAADVLDRHFHQLFPRHLRAEVDGLMATVVAGERVRHYETEAHRPDGMPLPVSLSLCTVADDEDQVVGTIVVAHDVTEQHLTQATLAEVESRVEEGEALAHVGSWLWDMRTGVVQWSAEFHRIHGVEPTDFEGTLESFFNFIHADDQAKVQSAMDTAVASGQPFDLEYRVPNASRPDVVVEVRAQPMFGSDGSTIGLRGIGQEEAAVKGARLSPSRPGS